MICQHAIQQIYADWADACSLHTTTLDQKALGSLPQSKDLTNSMTLHTHTAAPLVAFELHKQISLMLSAVSFGRHQLVSACTYG